MLVFAFYIGVTTFLETGLYNMLIVEECYMLSSAKELLAAVVSYLTDRCESGIDLLI